jgi:hypothetical protein
VSLSVALIALFRFRAFSVFPEIGTFGMYLEALVLDLESKFFRNRLAIPFHERGIYIMNMVAVRTDDLGLEGFGLTVESVKLVVLTNVDFSDDSAFNEKREAPV